MAARALGVASHLAPSVQPLYELATRVMGERLGRPATLEIATGYERCAADVDDVCFVCSVPYLLFAAEGRIRMEPIAAPVLRGERYAGRPIYFSDVIVHRRSPFRSFDDLRGCRWAYNEPYSHSGHTVVLHELAARGEDRSFFGAMVESGFHDLSLAMVVDGRVDAAAIDSQVLEIALRTWPALASELRIVATLGPSTIQPVVASTSRLDAAERETVQRALLDLAELPEARPVLEATGVERFVPIDDAGYADIRRMLAIVDGAGMLDAAWQATWRTLADGRPLPGPVAISPPARRPAAGSPGTPRARSASASRPARPRR